MKRRFLILLLAVCVFVLSACAPEPKTAALGKFSVTRLDMFDTVISLTGYAADADAFNETANAAFDELMELHKLYDVYNEYESISNICTINRNAGGDPVETDPRVIDLLLLAKEIAQVSGGAADVTSGSVLRLWHNARTDSLNDPGNAYLPDEAELLTAADHVGFDRLEIDTEKNTVRLTDPDALLDVGAIAKGYAVERVCASLPEGYLMSAGGNVCATGAKPDGSGWTVGIQDPDGDPSAILAKVSIRSGAVVTSGDYQRYYTVDGVRYHHIIDLVTRKPANRWRSVTVVCADSGVADGLSTALFVLPMEEGQKLLDRYDAEALWVNADGTQFTSGGMKDYLIK